MQKNEIQEVLEELLKNKELYLRLGGGGLVRIFWGSLMGF